MPDLSHIERLLLGDVYASTEPMENLQILCDDFGARFPGTPDEARAADFLERRLAEYGCAAHKEPYRYTGWTRGPASFALTLPVQRELSCISLPYCPPGTVEAEVVGVGMGTPAEFAAVDLRGRIAVVSSRTPADFGRWMHRKEKYVRAVLAGASAFVFTSEHGGLGPETGSLHDDGQAPIPGVSVSFEDGRLLARLAARHGTVRARITTADRSAPATSWNVVGELPGEGPGVVIAGCHYDGHDIAQGAIDPASGLVTVLEAARVLARHARLGCTVRFVAYGTEEIGLIGSHRYVEAHRGELDAIKLVVNLDSAGADHRKGLVVHQWPALQPVVQRWFDAMGAGDLPVGQKVSAWSDHFPFFKQGVATVGMGDALRAPHGRGWGHTVYDTVDKVRLSDLRDAAAVASRVLLRASWSGDLPARRPLSEVQAILDNDANLEGQRVTAALQAKLDG